MDLDAILFWLRRLNHISRVELRNARRGRF
jgi:hypothetical protein